MKQWLFILLMIPLALSANTEELIIEGNAYFSVGQYVKARDLYRKALKKETDDWKKPYILYNIGNVFLQQKRWNYALEIYNLILETPNVSLYLIPKVRINAAVALLGQAEFILEKEKDPFYISPSRLSNPITLLQAAKDSVNLAEKNFCEIYLAEDYEACPHLRTIKEIKLALLERTAYIGLLEVQYRLSTIPFREGLEILNQYLLSMIAQLEEWEQFSVKLSEPIHVGRSYKNIEPLWQTLKQRQSELNVQEQEIFRESRANYRNGITDIESVQVAPGIAGLKNAQNGLATLLEMIKVEDPLINELNTALDHLTNLLVFGKVTTKSLQEVRAKIQSVEQKARAELIAEKETSDALKRIKKAIEDFSSGDLKNTRLYLIGAAQSLEQGIIAFRLQSSEDPLDYLKAAIESQQDALDLAIEMQGLSDTTPGIQEMLVQSQNRSHNAGKIFVDNVFKWQKKQYHELAYGQVCQKKPWNHVMPLFHQGFQKSSEVNNLLSSPPPLLLGLIVSQQKKVLRLWRNTLQALEEDRTTAQEEKEEEDESKIDEEPEVDLTSRNINKILKTIIELDQQDRITQPQFFPKPEDAQRPW